MPRLDDVITLLTEEEEGAAEAEAAADARLDEARQAETAAARQLSELTRRDFEFRARRRSLETSLAERRSTVARIERQLRRWTASCATS